METTFNRDLTGGDVPPFSYTGIAHTFNNAPFNEYPFAMARLRWFTDSFDPVINGGQSRLSSLRGGLLEKSRQNGHFKFLQVTDAGYVDAVLDEIFRELEPGGSRDAHDLGPHEPGMGRWVNEDEFHDCHSMELPPGVPRSDLFDRVLDRLRAAHPAGAAVDDIYLYPPDYGDAPGSPVRHVFRIFAHAEASAPSVAAAGARLKDAVDGVLKEISAEAS